MMSAIIKPSIWNVKRKIDLSEAFLKPLSSSPALSTYLSTCCLPLYLDASLPIWLLYLCLCLPLYLPLLSLYLALTVASTRASSISI